MGKNKLLTLFAFVAGGFLSVGVAQSAPVTSFQRDSAILSFRPDGKILYEDYQNNASQLSKLYSFVSNGQRKLLSGLSHLNIVSYIRRSDIGYPVTLNFASYQASVVRALVKTRYGIPHSSITFSIDTTQNCSDKVRVDYVDMPVPLYSNSSIYFTESSSSSAAASSMAKYTPGVPYTNYWMHLAKINPGATLGTLASVSNQALPDVALYDEDVEDDILNDDAANMVTPPSMSPNKGDVTPSSTWGTSTAKPLLVPNLSQQPVYSSTSSEMVPDSRRMGTKSSMNDQFVYAQSGDGASARIVPALAIKTNLLEWLGVLPNIAIEVYMGSRMSLSFEGSYTWAWFMPEDRSYHLWSAGGELRTYFKGDKLFNGHFMGLYGNAGQYDFKLSDYGYQGDLVSFGVSYGYMLPIKRHFNMEFSLGVGATRYTCLEYKFTDGKNVVSEDYGAKYYIGPNKLKVALVWKF